MEKHFGSMVECKPTETLDELVERLRKSGFRITEPRLEILEILYAAHGSHHTIDDIVAKLKKKSNHVNLATVYNNINFLVENNVIYAYNFNGKTITYEINVGEHAHLVCTSCGNLTNITIPGLMCIEPIILKQSGFFVEDKKLEFYGLCSKCLKKNEKED